MKKSLVAVFALLLACIGACSTSTLYSASAHVWVAPAQHAAFVSDLRTFALAHNLAFHPSTIPANPGSRHTWEETGVIIVTPKQNDISALNTIAPDQFTVGIWVYDQSEHWRVYWDGLRAFMSQRYRWQDVGSVSAG